MSARKPEETGDAPRRDRAFWTPLRRETLSERIVDRLIEDIVAGRFGLGERLPPERELAGYLGVGRPTVREGLRALRAIGLVEVRAGEGTFVVGDHRDFLARAFGWSVLLDQRSIAEIIETRMAIESELAELAARRIDADGLAALHDRLDEMHANRRDVERFAAADLQFHLTIAHGAQNVLLERMLLAIQSLLAEMMRRALRRKDMELVVAQHRKIADAIDAHDPERARIAMREHLEDHRLDDVATRPAGRQALRGS